MGPVGVEQLSKRIETTGMSPGGCIVDIPRPGGPAGSNRKHPGMGPVGV